MKVQAIIAAGGSGVRFKSPIAKLLVSLRQEPILARTLKAFQKSSSVKSIIVVGHKKYLSDFRKIVRRYSLSKVVHVIAGGVTRQESVRNGLYALDKDTDFVIIHDGVRPFVTEKLIKDSLSCAKKHGAAVVAVPVKPTIKRVDTSTMTVEGTLNRNFLWEIQTPQVFRREIILKAHREIPDRDASDDACLVEKMGVKVKVVMGDYKNIKITTPDDLIFAEAILRSRNKPGFCIAKSARRAASLNPFGV